MKRWVPLLVFVLPTATMFVLWLFSGRERLSKSTKYVDAQVWNEAFEEFEPRKIAQAGPILGYYVGLLDGVLPVAAGAALAAGIAWWLQRRSRRRSGLGGV